MKILTLVVLSFSLCVAANSCFASAATPVIPSDEHTSDTQVPDDRTGHWTERCVEGFCIDNVFV